MHDLRLATRALMASPVGTAIAVMSLALGIGANTAIFSLVSQVWLRRLPVVAPARLAMISASSPSGRPQQFSYATFEEIQRQRSLFDEALAYTDCCGTAIVSIDGADYPADRQFVSGSFFSTLGVGAFRGRMLMPADDEPGTPDGAVAVVSHRFWRTQLGAREDVVGSRLSINRMPVTLVGVMPPEFFGVEVGRMLDVALPYRLAARFTSSPFDDHTQWLNIMVRLKGGLDLASTSAALRAVQPHVRAAAMPVKPRRDFLQAPLTLAQAGLGSSTLRQRFERPVLVLVGVAGLVLLAACAHVGNLLLVRGIARRHEMSVRIALGASRWRLIRQMLAESALLATAGAIAGLALAAVASRQSVALLSTSRDPIALDLALDWRVMTFAIAATVLTVFIAGVSPAFRATHVGPIEALKARGRNASSHHGHAASFNSLIAAQVTFSLILLVGAGLFVQTFARLSSTSLGFDRSGVMVVTVNAPTVAATERPRLFGRFVDEIAKVPGVAAAGGSTNPPIMGRLQGDVVVSAAGTAAADDAERIPQLNTITPGWMAAYGTGIRAGRDFDAQDTLAAPGVMLVNEAFLNRIAGGRYVLGTTLALSMRLPPGSDYRMGDKTIVGVVGDTVFRTLRQPNLPAVYLPLSQFQGAIPQYTVYVGVRSAPTAGAPPELTRAIGETLRGIRSDVTFAFEPLAQQVDESLAAERVLAIVSAFFGGVALLLAGLGLYGVTSYALAQRRTEIGIRMALGATRADVVRMVVSRALRPVGVGVLAGAAVSVWASTFVASLLYGLEPHDPATLVLSMAGMMIVATIAAWLPAWRASRLDPARALGES
jgi:putative ABC transport system permease protein